MVTTPPPADLLPCPTCRKSGSVDSRMGPVVCPTCQGRGEFPDRRTLHPQPIAGDAWEEAIAALDAAKKFIVNGIEYGYIDMPDPSTPDSAHDTLPMIRAALTALYHLRRPAQPQPSGELINRAMGVADTILNPPLHGTLTSADAQTIADLCAAFTAAIDRPAQEQVERAIYDALELGIPYEDAGDGWHAACRRAALAAMRKWLCAI